MADRVDALAALRRDLAAAEEVNAAAAETWRGTKGEKARSVAYEVMRRAHNRTVGLRRKLDRLETAAAKRAVAAARRAVTSRKRAAVQLRLFNPARDRRGRFAARSRKGKR